MKIKKLGLYLIATIVSTPSFTQGSVVTLDDQLEEERHIEQMDLSNLSTKALLKRDRQCAEAASTSDMETLWNCWTDDAIMLLSTELQIKGKGEIKAFTLRSREDPHFQISWSPVAAYVSPHDDMGYTYGEGTIVRTGKDGQITTQTQPYLSVWIKERDRVWKMIIEK